MQKIINEIVNDLIQLDPEFASMEQDLHKLVKKLLAAKPDAKIDANFKKRLQNELRAEATSLKNKQSLKYQTSFFNIFTRLRQQPSPRLRSSRGFGGLHNFLSINEFNMQKLAYTFAGATLAVLVFFTWQQFDGSDRFTMQVANEAVEEMDDSAALETKIEHVEAQAFGSLAREASEDFGMASSKGGGSFAVPESAMMSDTLIAPEYTVNKFVYRGSLNLPVGSVEVLKRVKGTIPTSSLIGSLSRFDFDLMELGSLRNAELQNFNIAEDREFGYMAMVDLNEGMISINQNWQKWPDPYRDCDYRSSPDCYDDMRLGKNDMLSDREILRIANAFVKDMGINLDYYGEPEIVNHWRDEVARFGGDDVYYPESISVTYPLKIQNQLVYSQGGGSEGLSVNVDQRHKKVSGAWGLQTQSYQASEYAAVADEMLFRKFLERGGLWGWMPEDATKIREVPLGDPETVLMKHWKYVGNDNQELIIPALRFPILEKPEHYYQTAVIIPLVEDILREQDQDRPYPEPYFLEKAEAILEESIGMANPASKKCEDDGYMLEIITDEEGNESGFCKNLEGKGCDEWEYFNGECEIPAVG